MRCSNCSAEWTFSISLKAPIRICPFCGGYLEYESNSVTKTVDGVLSEIVQRFGIDTLRSGTRTVALFADLAPQMEREKRLLSYLVQFGGNNRLLDARQLDSGKQVAEYRKVIHHLTDEQFIAQTAAEDICKSFLKAIGVSIVDDTINRQTSAIAPNVSASPPAQREKSNVLTRPNHAHTSSTVLQKKPPKVKNYQQYLALLESRFIQNSKNKLSRQQINEFISANNLAEDWKITFADVEDDLKAIYSQHTPPSPKPKASINSHPYYYISNYDDYMRELEHLYVSNGKHPLTNTQIVSFIESNQLDKRFHILAVDVENDLASLYRNHSSHQEPHQDRPTARQRAKVISSFEEYMDELEARYISNGRKELTTLQIVSFISEYGLSKTYGIGIADVKFDLHTIRKKNP